MMTFRKKVLISLTLSSAFYTNIAFADSSDNLVKSIMKLRSDVESLYSKIDENKDSFKSQIKSNAMQIADNEAQINRQETALKLSQQQMSKIKQKIAATSGKKDFKPMILEAINALKSEINQGLPFKKTERLASLAKIEKELKDGVITQEKALSLVWSNYDDAIRMTKEIGQFKQQIEINGKTKLAKIAKIGSVMMFFATPDEHVGYVTKSGDTYSYKTENDKVKKGQIVALFDALQKQIRTGYFSLPDALILRGAK